MIDRHRKGVLQDKSELSCATGEAVFGDSASTLSLSHLEPARDIPARCNVRTPRGHKRVRQYNMNSNNDSPSQSLSLSATSFGSLRSPVIRSTADGKSPRRLLRSTTPKSRKKMLESMKGALSERSLNDSIQLEKEERIGSEKIEEYPRTQARYCANETQGTENSISAFQKTATPTRIHGLRVDDLSIHLMRICIDEAEKSEAEVREQEVRRLEAGIKKCFNETDRVNRDIQKDVGLAAKLRMENKELLAEIATISLPYKQSVKQAQRQLESSIRALKQEIHAINDQMVVLNNRKESSDAETRKH